MVDTIKRDDFHFEIVNFPFLDGGFPRPLPMVYIFHSLFVLLEYVLMSVNSIIETNFGLLSYSNKDIAILNSVKHILNHTTDTQS